MAEGLLTFRGAAEYLGVSERYVKHLWNQRELAAVKVGHLVRFRLADLDRYCADHLVEAVQ